MAISVPASAKIKLQGKSGEAMCAWERGEDGNIKITSLAGTALDDSQDNEDETMEPGGEKPPLPEDEIDDMAKASDEEKKSAGRKMSRDYAS
jgi:hypothetical protein